MQVKSIEEHSAIVLTFIKLPFVFKTFLSVFSGRLRQVLLYCHLRYRYSDLLSEGILQVL